jgi:hypothetical protein
MAEQKYKVKLTALEMSLIKTSVEQTAYSGKISESITKIKKKMTPPQEKAPVHDINETARP